MALQRKTTTKPAEMIMTIEVKLILVLLIGIAFTWAAAPTINEYNSIKAIYPDSSVREWCRVTEGGTLAQGYLGPLFSLKCRERRYEPHDRRIDAFR
jgi:hypothetical protein